MFFLTYSILSMNFIAQVNVYHRVNFINVKYEYNLLCCCSYLRNYLYNLQICNIILYIFSYLHHSYAKLNYRAFFMFSLITILILALVNLDFFSKFLQIPLILSLLLIFIINFILIKQELYHLNCLTNLYIFISHSFYPLNLI